MQNINLSLFIPNSYLAETNDLKLKTYKIGIIGRALAVFRLNKVIIYNDSSFNDQKGRKDAKMYPFSQSLRLNAIFYDKYHFKF